jgi:hypothetical protein
MLPEPPSARRSIERACTDADRFERVQVALDGADFQGAVFDHGLDQRQQVVVGLDGDALGVPDAQFDMARQPPATGR